MKLSKNNDELIKEFGDAAAVMKDSKNNIYISNQRLPCEQPFQRLLTTYDGSWNVLLRLGGNLYCGIS